MYKSYIGRTGRAPIKQHLTRTVVVKYNAFFSRENTKLCFVQPYEAFLSSSKYCRYGVKRYPIHRDYND